MVLANIFYIFPQIDIAFSALFYDGSFYLSESKFFNFFVTATSYLVKNSYIFMIGVVAYAVFVDDKCFRKQALSWFSSMFLIFVVMDDFF